MRTKEIERLSSFPQDFFSGATEKKGWICDNPKWIQIHYRLEVEFTDFLDKNRLTYLRKALYNLKSIFLR